MLKKRSHRSLHLDSYGASRRNVVFAMPLSKANGSISSLLAGKESRSLKDIQTRNLSYPGNIQNVAIISTRAFARNEYLSNLWSRLRARARSLSQCTFYGQSPSHERSLTHPVLSLFSLSLSLSFSRFPSLSLVSPFSFSFRLTVNFSLRPTPIRARYAIPKIYGRSRNVCTLQPTVSLEPFSGWSMYRISRVTYLDTNEYPYRAKKSLGCLKKKKLVSAMSLDKSHQLHADLHCYISNVQ